METKPTGQLTTEELENRFTSQLRSQHEAWRDIDPDYAVEIKAVLDSKDSAAADGGEDPDYTHLKDFWQGPRDTEGNRVTRNITDADGNAVEWDTEGWEPARWDQVDHVPKMVSVDGENWTTAGVGTLHKPETGEYIAYRFTTDDKGHTTTAEGRIADDITSATDFLTAAERADLALPEPAVPGLESAAVPEFDRVEAMKDLRRQMVADSAKPDAGLAFAQEMTRMSMAARMRGASTDHKWSLTNRALVQLQAAQRGASIEGWVGGVRQWDAQDRELKPGAVPYEIWAPVMAGSKAGQDEDEDDLTGRRDTKADEDDAPKGRPRGKGASATALVGFRAVKVYDFTQTRRKDGQPDPDWSPSIPGGDEAMLARMKASSPLPIVEDTGGNLTGHAHGWTDNRKIVLDPHRSVGSQMSTLAHEMAHVELGHIEKIAAGEMTRGEAEQEAQLTAHLVLSQMLPDAAAQDASREGTAAYLNNWTKGDGSQVAGHKARWKMMQSRVDRSLPAVETILSRFYGFGGEAKPATDEVAAA